MITKWLENYLCCQKYLIEFSKPRHGDFVEGALFEQVIPGITPKVLGKLITGHELEYKKLVESVTWFALWITTGNELYERQLNNINLSYLKIKKPDCVNS